MFIKLSVGVFFMRVTIVPWHRWVTIAMLTISTSFGASFLFFAIFQCHTWPTPRKFTLLMLRGQCIAPIPGLAMNYTHAVLNAATDWVCGILPLFMIKQSRMPIKAKAAVVFLLGLAAM
jgi:hypothetical protein